MNDIEFMTTRANPGIDPTLSVWGWQIPVYLFLAGLVAGMMIVASAQEWKSRREVGNPSFEDHTHPGHGPPFSRACSPSILTSR